MMATKTVRQAALDTVDELHNMADALKQDLDKLGEMSTDTGAGFSAMVTYGTALCLRKFCAEAGIVKAQVEKAIAHMDEFQKNEQENSNERQH